VSRTALLLFVMLISGSLVCAVGITNSSMAATPREVTAVKPRPAVIAAPILAQAPFANQPPPFAEYLHLLIYVILTAGFILAALRRLSHRSLHALEAFAHFILCLTVAMIISWH
jgi:hypothetical protein